MESVLIQKRRDEFLLDSATLDTLPYEDTIIQSVISKIKEQKILNLKPTSKILDPTCGCGVFLVTAFNFLKQINKEALNNIYGVDLNESATKITRINLWLRNGKDHKSL